MVYTPLLGDYVASGVIASRPTGSVLGATLQPGSCAYYYATDTSTLYLLPAGTSTWETISGGGGGGTIEVSDGTNDFTGISKLLFNGGTVSNPTSGEAEYTPPGGGGGGGMTLISEYTTTGSERNINFSSIPGTYNSLRLEVTGNGAGAPGVTLNGDTGNNYSRAIQFFGTGSGGNADNNQPSWGVGDFSGGTPPDCSFFVMDLPGYVDTTFDKFMSFSAKQATSNFYGYTLIGTGTYSGTVAAINEVNIFMGSGNWGANSVARLFGY